jgi:AcrR family transcriptional regulator
MKQRMLVAQRAPDGSFELLWGQREKLARGPKPSFRLAEIVKAGVAIADRHGLAALTMAAVAQRLGVTTMALYRYVPNKDALIDLVADSVMRRPPKPLGSSWRADISAWAHANLALVRRHRWLHEIISTRASAGPNWARWLDAGLQSLASLPFSAGEKLAVLLLVDGHFRAGAQLLVGAKASQEWANNFGRMLQTVAGDPRYPTLTAMVTAGRFAEPRFDLEHMIEFGFERLLDGVEALAETRSRGRG